MVAGAALLSLQQWSHGLLREKHPVRDPAFVLRIVPETWPDAEGPTAESKRWLIALIAILPRPAN